MGKAINPSYETSLRAGFIVLLSRVMFISSMENAEHCKYPFEKIFNLVDMSSLHDAYIIWL